MFLLVGEHFHPDLKSYQEKANLDIFTSVFLFIYTYRCILQIPGQGWEVPGEIG